MRSRRTFAAWLALFAMAMQALWPLVAQAQPSSQLLVPICTVGGDIHYVTLDGKPAGKPAAATGEHCKLCVFGVERLALPAQGGLLPLAVDAVALHAGTVSEAPPVSVATHSPSQPRAPPAFS
mgnify:CR=1 FL=1